MHTPSHPAGSSSLLTNWIIWNWWVEVSALLSQIRQGWRFRADNRDWVCATRSPHRWFIAFDKFGDLELMAAPAARFGGFGEAVALAFGLGQRAAVAPEHFAAAILPFRHDAPVMRKAIAGRADGFHIAIGHGGGEVAFLAAGHSRDAGRGAG